jgi:hypothetical protein
MNRRRFMTLTGSTLAMLGGGQAFAQQPQQSRSGTPEEHKACNRDVQKFCRLVIDQGDFTILACLKENRAKISQACDQVLKNHNQ